MSFAFGAIMALGALVAWGVGDFLIQRGARKIGDWETLFFITAVGAIALAPFVYNDLAAGFGADVLPLLAVSSTLFIASLLDFEALKKGKIATVEAVMALEVPIASMFAFAFINEAVNHLQLALISLIILGIILVSMKSFDFKQRARIEKGVVLAALGSGLMGASGFLMGFAARETNPLVANWFTSAFIALACLAYLAYNGKLANTLRDSRKHWKLILGVSTADNLAWVCFAFATLSIPIAVAMALSESYVALAALLGLWVNKERLLAHQQLGLVTTIVAAVALAGITG